MNNMKRLLSCLLVLCLLTTALPLCASAAYSWQEAYQEFIFYQSYLYGSGTLYEGHNIPEYYIGQEEFREIGYALHDMDNNGTPELIISNGGYATSQFQYYLYTYKNGKVAYLASSGIRPDGISYDPEKKYPGLFFESSAQQFTWGSYIGLDENGVCSGIRVYSNHVEMQKDEMVVVDDSRTSDTELLSAFSRRKDLVVTNESHFVIRGADYIDMGYFLEQYGYSALKRSENDSLFADVAKSSWYYDDLEYDVDWGLVSGTGGNLYSPNGSVTRAMFVTILGRVQSLLDYGKTSVSFLDVESGSWYDRFVEWAASNGIVSGMGNGRFAPNQSITREQMAVILANYITSQKYEIPALENPVSFFTDANSISPWAYNSVETIRKIGLISGYPDGRFGPKDTVTRAQVASIFARLNKAVCSLREGDNVWELPGDGFSTKIRLPTSWKGKYLIIKYNDSSTSYRFVHRRTFGTRNYSGLLFSIEYLSDTAWKNWPNKEYISSIESNGNNYDIVVYMPSDVTYDPTDTGTHREYLSMSEAILGKFGNMISVPSNESHQKGTDFSSAFETLRGDALNEGSDNSFGAYYDGDEEIELLGLHENKSGEPYLFFFRSDGEKVEELLRLRLAGGKHIIGENTPFYFEILKKMFNNAEINIFTEYGNSEKYLEVRTTAQDLAMDQGYWAGAYYKYLITSRGLKLITSGTGFFISHSYWDNASDTKEYIYEDASNIGEVDGVTVDYDTFSEWWDSTWLIRYDKVLLNLKETGKSYSFIPTTYTN